MLDSSSRVLDPARVSGCMHHGIFSCDPHAPLAGVAAIMARPGVRAVAVYERDGAPHGIVSDRNIVGAVGRAGAFLASWNPPSARSFQEPRLWLIGSSTATSGSTKRWQSTEPWCVNCARSPTSRPCIGRNRCRRWMPSVGSSRTRHLEPIGVRVGSRDGCAFEIRNGWKGHANAERRTKVRESPTS